MTFKIINSNRYVKISLSITYEVELKDRLLSDVNIAAVCGYYCGGCQFLGEQCTGCGNVAGKPFWTKDLEQGPPCPAAALHAPN